MAKRYFDYLVYIMRWLLLYTEPSATVYYRLLDGGLKEKAAGGQLPLLCNSAFGEGERDADQKEPGPSVYGLRTGSFAAGEEPLTDGKEEWIFLNDLPDFLSASLQSQVPGMGDADVRAIRPDDVKLEIFVVARKE